jgi:hypothetical protein
MTKSWLFKIGCRSVLAVAFAAQTASAVILFGSGDPAYNTTPPAGALANSGWQYEGQWGAFLGTPIAPRYFLAAHHVGGAVGDTFTFHGVNYTTTAYWDDPSSDLRIWQVSGVFPTYAPLYSTSDETGRPLMVFGRGTQRGAPVVASIGMTNAGPALAGWQDGSADGVLRWGQNHVRSVYWTELIIAFTGTQGANEAYLSGGDSSGAIFIQDDAGVWKLAGINYAIDGPFATNAGSSTFYGAIYNEAGLYVNGSLVPADGGAHPAYFYATRVSAEQTWIQSVVGNVPAAPMQLNVQLSIQLNIQQSGGSAILSYPTNAAGYTLQCNQLPGGGATWQDVTNAAVLNGTNWNVTLPMNSASAFFRLQSAN